MARVVAAGSIHPRLAMTAVGSRRSGLAICRRKSRSAKRSAVLCDIYPLGLSFDQLGPIDHRASRSHEPAIRERADVSC